MNTTRLLRAMRLTARFFITSPFFYWEILIVLGFGALFAQGTGTITPLLGFAAGFLTGTTIAFIIIVRDWYYTLEEGERNLR